MFSDYFVKTQNVKFSTPQL